MKAKNNGGPLETAVRLLARRDHTVQELRTKLRRSEFTQEEIDETIINLRDKGYLDDTRLRQRKIEKMVSEKRHGIRGITNKLWQSGLQVSEAEVRKYYSEDMEWDNAVSLLKKRFMTWDGDSYPRLARYISNRGFSSSIMTRLAEECRKHQ